MQVAFFCCFRQGVAGMSQDLGRDVPDLEKLYARKLWADFSYPIQRHRVGVEKVRYVPCKPGKRNEQRSFYANKAQTEVHHFCLKHFKKRDTRL